METHLFSHLNLDRPKLLCWMRKLEPWKGTKWPNWSSLPSLIFRYNHELNEKRSIFLLFKIKRNELNFTSTFFFFFNPAYSCVYSLLCLFAYVFGLILFLVICSKVVFTIFIVKISSEKKIFQRVCLQFFWS